MKCLIYFENVFYWHMSDFYFLVKIYGNIPVLNGNNMSPSLLLMAVIIPHFKGFSS